MERYKPILIEGKEKKYIKDIKKFFKKNKAEIEKGIMQQIENFYAESHEKLMHFLIKDLGDYKFKFKDDDKTIGKIETIYNYELADTFESILKKQLKDFFKNKKNLRWG